MVIDMKVIGEMEKKKEKVFIIIIMVIEKWAIIQMIIKLENMSYLLQMEKSKLKFINKIYLIKILYLNILNLIHMNI